MKDTENFNNEAELEQEENLDAGNPESEVEESVVSEEGEEDFDIFSDDELSEDEPVEDDSADLDEADEKDLQEGEPEAAEELPAAAPASGLEKYQALNNRAKEVFKARHGVEYDQFEDHHPDALADIKQVLRKEEEALDVVDSIYKQNDPGFIEFVKKEAYEAKNGDMQALRDAEARGDFSKTVNFLKQIETKYKARKKAGGLNNAPVPSSNQRRGERFVNPPKTMAPGTGKVPAARPDNSVLSPEDLGFE